MLTPMDANAFATYRDAASAGYADDNITAGRWPKDGALQRSYADFDASLPQGLSSIGLHVSDNNVGAQALYHALGYGGTGINMHKQLGSDTA